MPRSSRSSGGARSAPAGARGAHTMAAPTSSRPQQHHAPPPPPAQAHAAPAHPPATAVQQPQQPGLFSQMASTAAGVAVGSTVGHGLSNLLFGGSSSSSAEPASTPAPAPPQSYDQQQASSYSNQGVGVNCETQSKDFIKCLESTNDMQSCSYYLEQLKACQAAARPY
ncbi:hypothetical protein IE53DRAFT_386020 [Violaceomyces palustris]|uniref:Uncharacterized protein n=1 Tax=Violaceomyces palustris TaxID=1673888 RepID=A0ACD0P0L4_9BASI|nr:hypothetical protein IE53DRAFT_386020 [Violaceomyces palustris]